MSKTDSTVMSDDLIMGKIKADSLVSALAACVDLIEGWAYGPLFAEVGIRWPDGVCRAPALVEAKRILGLINIAKGESRVIIRAD